MVNPPPRRPQNIDYREMTPGSDGKYRVTDSGTVSTTTVDYPDRLAHQDALNAELAESGVDEVHRSLVAAFEADHAGHTQYDGYTDSSYVVIARHKIRASKGYDRAEKGDVLLALPASRSALRYTTVYCPRCGWNVSIADDDLETP